jgi:hypothetical protein
MTTATSTDRIEKKVAADQDAHQGLTPSPDTKKRDDETR